MEYETVSSSSVGAVGYDVSTNTLGVRFLNGSEYHYFGVPQGLFDGLRSASSVGRFLDQFIKKAGFQYARVA